MERCGAARGSKGEQQGVREGEGSGAMDPLRAAQQAKSGNQPGDPVKAAPTYCSPW